MNRKLIPLLTIAIFLAVQALSLMHTSQYGAESHEHNGEICDIYLSADHKKLLLNTPAKLMAPELLTFKTILPKAALPSFAKVQIFEARAPPIFS